MPDILYDDHFPLKSMLYFSAEAVLSIVIIILAARQVEARGSSYEYELTTFERSYPTLLASLGWGLPYSPRSKTSYPKICFIQTDKLTDISIIII